MWGGRKEEEYEVRKECKLRWKGFWSGMRWVVELEVGVSLRKVKFEDVWDGVSCEV